MVAFFSVWMVACCEQDGDYLSPFHFSFCANEEQDVIWFIQLNNNFYVKQRKSSQIKVMKFECRGRHH